MAEIGTWAGTGRARVVDVDDRSVRVRMEGSDEGLDCDVLRTSAAPPLLLPGDAVLVWAPEGERGVVLGLVESPSASPEIELDIAPETADAAARDDGPDDGPDDSPDAAPTEDGIPDSLVLEARESLVLRVGEGSIVLRGDGKIVIRGRDLLSRATRTHRIKGGSVAIN